LIAEYLVSYAERSHPGTTPTPSSPQT
jgi:hypothetical protein